MWINECAYCKRQQHTTTVWNITAVQKTLLVLKRCQEKIFSLLHLFCTVPTVSGTRSSTVCYYVSFTSVGACFCLLLGFSQFKDSGSQRTQGTGPTGLVYNPPLDRIILSVGNWLIHQKWVFQTWMRVEWGGVLSFWKTAGTHFWRGVLDRKRRLKVKITLQSISVHYNGNALVVRFLLL